MVTPLGRAEIFRASSFADNLIAFYQRSYASDFDHNDKADVATLKKYYDHLQPYAPVEKEIDGQCVMALIKESLPAYNSAVITALQQLFRLLNIHQLYCIDFLNTSFNDFAFENFHKRNELKKLLKGSLHHEGFSFDAADINKVLPLLSFDRKHYRPRVFIIAADGGVRFSMNICRDGNFHCNYYKEEDQFIHAAAAKVGITVGDVDICWNYSVPRLPIIN